MSCRLGVSINGVLLIEGPLVRHSSILESRTRMGEFLAPTKSGRRTVRSMFLRDLITDLHFCC
jgi:hypothetical protein